MTTRSEELFEKFCGECGINLSRLATGTDSTPDYELEVNGAVIVAEVKQLDREPDPNHREGKVKVYSTVPGEHIRRKINKAGPQLRAIAKEMRPSLLVVYNNIHRVIGVYSEPYDFLVAMYGLQNVVLGIPQTGEPYIKGHRFGPKRKMTEAANTSFSALALLREDQKENLSLDVYHNVYAAIPLDPTILSGDRIAHYSIPKGSIEFTEWEKIGDARVHP
jgi:hypothetical protein